MVYSVPDYHLWRVLAADFSMPKPQNTVRVTPLSAPRRGSDSR